MIFVARAVQEHSRVTKRYEACDKIGPELRGVTMLKIDMKHLETIEYYRPKHIWQNSTYIISTTYKPKNYNCHKW